MAPAAEHVVFVGGPILTLDGPTPTYAEAVVIGDGLIAFVGGRDEARQRFPDAAVRDLDGRALLPGFVDAHSHLLGGIDLVQHVNVGGAPVGPCRDIADVVAALARHRDEQAVPEGDWIVGWGYDPDTLAERRQISRVDLDDAFPAHPVLLHHVSWHGAVLNGVGLARAGIDARTPAPDGGVIARLEGTDEPAGLLMETAMLPALAALPQPDADERLSLLSEVQRMYAAHGYTHAQDGLSSTEDIRLLQRAAREGLLFLDVVALASFAETDSWLGNPDFPVGGYDGHFRIAGMKAMADGSPQGRTAYLTQPYLTEGPGGETDWRGAPLVPPEALAALVSRVLAAGVQVFVHANGDAAMDVVVAAVRDAGVSAADNRRTIMIHSQVQRTDQTADYLELGISPSYFSNHCFFWGDVHRANLGPDRAALLSPLRSAAAAGLVVSNHCDFPVTPLDPFHQLWTAMARTSRSGVVLGPDERLDAYAALQALTTGAAYQVFEENRKGKIAAGLLADLVVLSEDPVVAGVEKIRDVTVLETIKEGVTVHRR
jgi:hypothetical protein